MSDREVSGFSHRVPGEEITWAGICPWTGNLCFGTESGRLYPAPDDTGQQPAPIKGHKLVGEPVSGVAFSGELLCVTSRTEVVVGRRRADGELEIHEPLLHGGAHGILALPSGGFVAPLGTDGLLFLREEEGKFAANVGVIDGERPNFYKAALLDEMDRRSVLACAARDSGLFAMIVEAGRVATAISHEFPGIDAVDVCSLKSREHPRAAVALDHDGSLLFYFDLFEKKEPLVIAFSDVSGVPYTVLSAQGHVFILTSAEFIVIPDLADKFLRGERMDQPIDAWDMPVQAVDAFLCGDESVLLINEEKAVEYHVADLAGQVADPANRTTLRPTLTMPTWRTTPRKMMVFVPAA